MLGSSFSDKRSKVNQWPALELKYACNPNKLEHFVSNLKNILSCETVELRVLDKLGRCTTISFLHCCMALELYPLGRSALLAGFEIAGI